LAAESALRCEFKNGSRFISLPGSEKTVRGYAAANLIIIDEADGCTAPHATRRKRKQAASRRSILAI
jgi:hypothetical protein